MKEIESIYLSDLGWRYKTEGRFEEFYVKGEMALILWIRHHKNDGTKAEYNSKYIIEINYKPSP